MNENNNITNEDRVITTTRIVNATPALAFKSWSDPVHLKNWWGPKGFTNTFHEFDFRPGGTWRFTMHGPEVGHYENECVFTAIEEAALIEWDRISHPLFSIRTTFEKAGEGKTKIVFRMIFKTVGECNKLRKFVPEKNEENFDRLEEELKLMSDE